MATEKLEVSLLENLKALSAKKNELTLKAGQIHLEIKELTNISNRVDDEYSTTAAKLDELLTELQSKYPNGEIDLLEGTVTF